MRHAYALLGLSFLIVFTGAFILFERAQAPTNESLSSDTTSSMQLSLTSSAFEPNGIIPGVHTCDGENTNPPLSIANVPTEAKSLVLVMDDPDIPAEVKAKMNIEIFNHWVVYDIAADTTEIVSGQDIGTLGVNSAGNNAYTGPCPPSEYEPYEHRYVFRLYAVNRMYDGESEPTLDVLEAWAKEHALESAELIGRYSRNGQ
ncbi:YbhB/YbcL family Raf kinase inhibitor-like protein [Candidatus Pacebacteria bacterium]|nr:YbhB/YbcL family Raf kinase inhibitor-like protein [Candidatus Paceibacterota bacterium]